MKPSIDLSKLEETMLLKRVIISPLDNKNHKERYSLLLWKQRPDCAVTFDNLEDFIGRIDLPPFKKRKGQWLSEVNIKNNGILPITIPDCELWGVLVSNDENVSSEFNIDWEYYE